MMTASSSSVADSVRRLFGVGTVAGLGEAQLLDRFATGGDPMAFEALLRRHGPMVLGVCRRVLDDPNDVDDAFQATFLLLVQKARSIRNRDDLATWLHGVARRVAVRARVAGRRRKEVDRLGGGRETAPEGPSSGAEADEVRAILDDELAGLPERYRSALVLCDLEGETHEQAAERLRCPVGTIKSRLSRARERLRCRLVRRGLGPLAVPLIPNLPESLASRTVRGAALMLDRARGLAAGTIPSGVDALVEGGLPSMTFTPPKIAAVALLAVGLVASGVAALARPGSPRQANSKADDSAGLAVEPPAERFTLDNGLTAYLRPIRGAKQTALVVLYSVGNDHDPAGKSGLSHLAEHVYLMAAAGETRARTADEFYRRYPTGANGQTGDRYTVLSTSFPAADLDGELRDAAARMGDLRVTIEDVEGERPRVLQELENMYANFPPLAAQNNARDLIRPTPGGGRRGGEAASVKALRPLDVQQHLGRFYRPRNAILSLSGDFDPSKARTMIRDQFARLAPGEKAPPRRTPGAPKFGAVTEIVANSPDPDARPMACLAYLAPGPEGDLYAPFLILVCRLWADMEKLGGDGMGFPVYFTPMDDGAVVAVSSPARTGETSGQALARLEAFVAGAVAPKLGPDEASAALQQLGFFFGTMPLTDAQLAQNPYGVAFGLGRREQMKVDPARFRRSLEAVTDESLRKAAAEFFAPARHAGAFVKN